jgi:hypothetical protein
MCSRQTHWSAGRWTDVNDIPFNNTSPDWMLNGKLLTFGGKTRLYSQDLRSSCTSNPIDGKCLYLGVILWIHDHIRSPEVSLKHLPYNRYSTQPNSKYRTWAVQSWRIWKIESLSLRGFFQSWKCAKWPTQMEKLYLVGNDIERQRNRTLMAVSVNTQTDYTLRSYTDCHMKKIRHRRLSQNHKKPTWVQNFGPNRKFWVRGPRGGGGFPESPC